MMQRTVTLHSKESAIVRYVIADSNTSKKRLVLITVQQWTQKN